MTKLVLCALALLVVMYVGGCGGSSTPDSSAVTVEIQETRFFSPSVTLTTNSRVQWVNTTNTLHQVVSGVLLSTSNPVVVSPVISINENNSFTPSVMEANFGDTVQFQNNRVQAFVMDILDSSNVVIATLNFVRSGQIINFSGFPSAGFYTYQQHGNHTFAGHITVFGRPKPDGAFQSQVLGPGGSFTTQFPTSGVFSYYDLDQDDPNRSFRTGKITVQ